MRRCCQRRSRVGQFGQAKKHTKWSMLTVFAGSKDNMAEELSDVSHCSDTWVTK
jgi:hypothetical protein